MILVSRHFRERVGNTKSGAFCRSTEAKVSQILIANSSVPKVPQLCSFTLALRPGRMANGHFRTCSWPWITFRVRCPLIFPAKSLELLCRKSRMSYHLRIEFQQSLTLKPIACLSG